MKRLVAGVVGVVGLMALLGGVAQADPRFAALLTQQLAMRQGTRHGLAAGSSLNLSRLNPAVRMNPVLSTLSRPEVAASIAAAQATRQQGRAMGAYTVGNVPLGQLHQTGGSYLSGVGHGLITSRSLVPVP
jgi:hypothetical protein